MAPKAKRRAALYLRVSTDKQTVENQRQGLIEAAKQRGWTVLANTMMRVSAAPRAATSDLGWIGS